MNKHKHRIIAVISMFSWLLLFSVGQVKADYWAMNIGTGFNSENEVEAEFEDTIEVSNDNFALIENFANIFTDTGNNNHCGNIDCGSNGCSGGCDESSQSSCDSCGSSGGCESCSNGCNGGCSGGCEGGCNGGCSGGCNGGCSGGCEGEGSVDSGDIDIAGNIENEINFSDITVSDLWSGDAEASNQCTGAESENDADVEIKHEVELSNINKADVDNEVGIVALTGFNQIDGSEGTSGDIDAAVDIMNNINEATIDFSDGSGGMSFSAVAMNTGTGFNSENEAELEMKDEIAIVNFNLADIDNEVGIIALTGDGCFEGGCDGGDFSSGDISADVNIENEANTTEVAFDFSGPNELLASNSQTGCNSENKAEIKLENDIALVNLNAADIDNGVFMYLDTGGNSADDGNDTSLSSGSIDANVDIVNTANNISNDVSIDLGGMDVLAANEYTGNGSENEAETEMENEVELVNVNAADIDNDVNIYASTGCNSAEGGCGSTDVASGDINADVNIENEVNTISTDLSLDLGGEVGAVNSNTGCGSENEAEASIENEVSVVNTNVAEVSNTVNIISNTGGNSANGNSGGNSVQSGSAQISFGITNTANNTSVGN